MRADGDAPGPEPTATPQAPPDLGEALHALGADSRAGLKAASDSLKALRILVAADFSLARSAFGRALAFTGVAIAFGASAWLLLMALMVLVLNAAGLGWIASVAIPAALPQVFVGLFMGLGASFSVLVTAEMMGVKAGLGWYLQWAQGWAAYANMYAALFVMAVLCSGLITLLFAVRDRVLSWQKGTVKW